MKNKVILVFVFCCICLGSLAQCNIYTQSTFPGNPMNNSGNTLDWTVDNPVTWYYNASKPPLTIRLPYYCSGINTNINDGCSNENLDYYQQIRVNHPTASLAQLNKFYDILPEDGWEVLSYNFGSASNPTMAPYFSLYNKYTGKVKLFVLAVAPIGQVFSSTRAALNVFANGNSALLNHSSSILPILSNSPQGSTWQAATSLNDIASLDGTQSSGPQHQWLGAEWIAAYDPGSCQNTDQFSFSIQFFNSSDFDSRLIKESEPVSSVTSFNCFSNTSLNSGLNAEGGISFKTNVDPNQSSILKSDREWSICVSGLKSNLADISAQGGWTGSTSSIGTGNFFVNDVATGIYEANNLGPSGQSQSSVNSAVMSALNTSGNGIMTNALGAQKNVFGGTGSIIENPYLASTLGLVDFFIVQDGDITSDPQPPVSYRVHDKVEYTLKTGTSPYFNGYNPPVGTILNNKLTSMPLPGTASSYTGIDKPLYNNTLGVFNIYTAPVFEAKSIGISTDAVPGNITNYGVDPNQSGGILTSANTVPQFKFIDYKLSAPLKYIINPAAGLTVKSIDAAFVFEYDGRNDPTYLVPINQGTYYDQKPIPYYPSMFGYWYTYNGVTNKYTGDGATATIPLSQVISSLKTVGMELDYQSPGFNSTDITQNANDSKIRFRTKYVPLQCLSNLDFILCGSSITVPTTYVKLYCKFERSDGKTITAVYTFDVSGQVGAASAQAQAPVPGVGGGSMYYYFSKPQLDIPRKQTPLLRVKVTPHFEVPFLV